METTAEKPPEPAPVQKPQYRQVKPNGQWPEEIRFLIRVYVAEKGEKLPACPVCNSKKRGRWTMLCPFFAHTFGQFVVVKFDQELAPLTLVCSDHPIWPTRAIIEAL